MPDSDHFSLDIAVSEIAARVRQFMEISKESITGEEIMATTTPARRPLSRPSHAKVLYKTCALPKMLGTLAILHREIENNATSSANETPAPLSSTSNQGAKQMSDMRHSSSICWATSREEREPPSNTNRTVANLLDGLIKTSNQLCFRGISYRPYWMMCDIATVLSFGYALVFSAHFPSASPGGLVVAIVVALLAYKVVRELKAAFGKISARSFLQDCLLIIIPSFLIVSWLFKQPIDLMLAFLGTLMPLYGGFARVGCFLGGCCYGKHSLVGVLYPDYLFETAKGGCRKYSPGQNPKGRVFPIQLVEAAAQGTLFITLFVLIWIHPHLIKCTFCLYLTLYAAVRFILDFFRLASARPRLGPFSEAQCVCIIVFGLGFSLLLATSLHSL
jgi:phosphatidylglycerol:prolipoprotein diacylglycerol transferase